MVAEIGEPLPEGHSAGCRNRTSDLVLLLIDKKEAASDVLALHFNSRGGGFPEMLR
jgi:hypothetical protein